MKERAKCFHLSQAERRRLLIAFACALAWCALAHGYCFSHLTLSHDSLKEFYLYDARYHSGFTGNNIQWKISLGRFFESAYHMIVRGPLATPWLAGALSAIWLGLAVWLTAQMFSMRSPWLIALTAGLFCVNIPVIAMAGTYVTDLDANMFAVLAATFGAWLWSRGGKRAWLAALPLAVALGIYQCMVSVAIALMMLVCLFRLMDGTPAKAVLAEGVKAIAVLAVGGALYWLSMRAVCKISGVSLMDSNNGMVHMGDFLHSSIPQSIGRTYKEVFDLLLAPPSLTSSKVVTVATALLLLVGAGSFLVFLAKRGATLGSKLLALALVALLPLGMNLSCFINNGATIHDLMLFAVYLTYLGCLLLARWLCGQLASDGKTAANRPVKLLCGVLVAVVLWMNVQTANGVYVKKEIERQEAYSYMTRVLTALDNTEGYIPKETPVAFFCETDKRVIPAFNSLYGMTGQSNTSMITRNTAIDAFFTYGLNADIRLVDFEDLDQLGGIAGEMPAYPLEGSIRWAGDTLVVKLG